MSSLLGMLSNLRTTVATNTTTSTSTTAFNITCVTITTTTTIATTSSTTIFVSNLNILLSSLFEKKQIQIC